MGDDEALAARDPSLPGLLGCLDPGRLAERLGAAPSEVVVRYVRYKRSTSVVTSFTVGSGPSLRWWSARAGAPGLPGVAGKLAKHGSVAPDLSVLTPLEEHREIPLLVRLRKDPSVLSERLGLVEPSCETLRFKPGRRWVARLWVPGRAVALKAYSSSASVLPQGRRDLLPSVLPSEGSSHRYAFLAFPWVVGGALELRSDEDLAALGALLARLHAAPLLPDPASLPDPLVSAAALWDLDPSLGPVAQDLARRLLAPPLSGPPVTVHGDLSVDQVVVGPDGLVLLDLDRSGTGEPALDVARLLAALDVEAVAASGSVLPEAERNRVRSVVLERYRSNGGRPLEQVLPHWEALMLLAAASEPFRSRSTRWRADVAEALGAALRRAV